MNARPGAAVPPGMTTRIDMIEQTDDRHWHARGAELALADTHARRWVRSSGEVEAEMRTRYAADLPTGPGAEARTHAAMREARRGYSAMQGRLGGDDDLAHQAHLQPSTEAAMIETELARVTSARSVAVLLANQRRVHATLAAVDGDVLLVCERAPILAVLAGAPKATPPDADATHPGVGRVVMRIVPLLGTGAIVSATPVSSEVIDTEADERLLVEFTRVTGRHVRRVRAAVGSHVTLSTKEATCTLRRPAALAVLRRMPDADASLSAGTNGDVERFAGVVGALAAHGAIVTMSF